MKKSPLWVGVLAALTLQAPFYSFSAIADDTRTKIEPRELMRQAELVVAGKVVDIQYKDAEDGTPHTFVTYAYPHRVLIRLNHSPTRCLPTP